MSRIESQRPPDAVIPGLHPSPQLEQTQKVRQQDVAKTGNDEVDVSSRAKMLNRIAAAVATVPDIRAERNDFSDSHLGLVTVAIRVIILDPRGGLSGKFSAKNREDVS